MERRKKLPIGIQTFRVIRDLNENYVYVDKTEIALNLIEEGRYYFLSRPRRFGKSLFLDTLSEIFKGNKELFEGLYIHDKWDWNETYPVIKIDLGMGRFSETRSINNRLRDVLLFNAELLDIPFEEIESEEVGAMLEKLIFRLWRKTGRKIVVLIDEYDKPILDNIHKQDKSISLEARNILRDFYSALKVNDAYLRFVFITGVSKFSKLNLFSGLNNIEDITIDERYATITGYTHNDLKKVFSDYIDGVDLEEVKRWYNGYNYLGEPVYNPFDILLFFAKGNKFRNYWWQTGNPAFLIEKLKEKPEYLPELETALVSEESLNAFDVEHINMKALLWQTGYLTFDKEVGDPIDLMYQMKVPNLEVQKSLNHLFFCYLSNLEDMETQLVFDIKNTIREAGITSFIDCLKSMFASIPYTNYVNNTIGNYEGYYASVIFAFLSSLGFSVVAEDTTNKGRIDMTMIGTDSIFIIEFKVDMPSEAALHQIKSKRYYEKYTAQQKAVHLLGIHFDSEEKNIADFEHELLKV